MSKYKVDNYINTYFNNIYKDLPTTKAYTLGIGNGMFQLYKYIKDENNKEIANEIFESLSNQNDEYSKILKTLIGLENEESTKVEMMMEEFTKKKANECTNFTDDEMELIEKFMDFLWKERK